MANLLKGVELVKNDGSSTKGMAEDVLKNKVVALYFSAHWCPPCRAFTGILKEFHMSLEYDEVFEVVFVSSDRSEDGQKSYLKEAHGNWYYLPFGSKKIGELNKQFGVTGIPQLTIIDADGKVLKKNATDDVRRTPPNVAVNKWKASSA